MDRHRVMHFDERAQKCDECGRAFKRKEELARHMKIHTNDRPYKCTHCALAFIQRRDLKQHQERMKKYV
jgi:KRAB domain-containing zinc finger protein